jgi:hypothetical protein
MVKVDLPPDRLVSYGKINYYNKVREEADQILFPPRNKHKSRVLTNHLLTDIGVEKHGSRSQISSGSMR